MGASTEKKKRQELKQSGVNVNEKKLTEEEIKTAKYKKWAVIAVILIAVFAVVVITLSSNLLYNVVPSVTVGDYKFTAADYDYYRGVIYNQYYNNYYSYYGEYAYIFMPEEAELQESTLTYMEKITMQYDAAKKAGFTLNDEQLQEMEDVMATVEQSAASYDVSVKTYLASMYGRGVNEKNFRENLEFAMTATAYSDTYLASIEVSQADKDAYYETNKDELDGFIFRYLYLDGSGNTTEVDENEDTYTQEEAMEYARDVANQIVEKTAGSEENFTSICKTLTGEDSTRFVCFGANIAENMSEECAAWLKDAGRKPGDAGSIEMETGVLVIFYIDREDNDYLTKDVRHILISVADETAEAEEEPAGLPDAEAKAKAEDILAQWMAGEKTEASFAALADEYSDDTSEGGLYTNVYQNQMVPEFNAWIYDEARQPGDAEIVKSADYGYHVMYFVGDGVNYKDYLCDSGARSEKYNAWADSLIGNYKASANQTILDYTR